VPDHKREYTVDRTVPAQKAPKLEPPIRESSEQSSKRPYWSYVDPNRRVGWFFTRVSSQNDHLRGRGVVC
jgi:hypothetical protein